MSKKLALRLGKRIKELRIIKKITQEKFAYELDISKGYLSDIESGNKIPSVEMLERISKSLDCDIKEFFY
jgi:transcriptional regulator with XRE-family HTH domain